LSLLSKNTEKHFPPPDISFLDWARDLFVLSVFESAELTAAEEEELIEIRNARRLEHPSRDMASFWFPL
jgi:hypothetical protein